MQARRNVLKNVNIHRARPDHAGLWFDRFLEGQHERGGDPKGYKQLIEEVCNIRVSAAYEAYYHRWQEALEDLGAECRVANTQGRMIVGLGAASVIETSVRLHSTYGVPLIPGSALKGVAASFAHQRLEDKAWRKGKGHAHKIIFGTAEEAGFVTFYDALYVPDSGGPLHPDVITVHHQDYYQSGDVPPADWDNPNPVSFVSATGSYLIALGGNYPIWVNAAFNVLELALHHEGVGAKTSSGYGRLSFSDGFPEDGGVRSVDEEESEIPDDYERGKVINWIAHKGFGFIAPHGGGGDVFVHHSELPEGVTALQTGQYVFYRRQETEKGPRATDVRLE